MNITCVFHALGILLYCIHLLLNTTLSIQDRPFCPIKSLQDAPVRPFFFFVLHTVQLIKFNATELRATSGVISGLVLEIMLDFLLLHTITVPDTSPLDMMYRFYSISI